MAKYKFNLSSPQLLFQEGVTRIDGNVEDAWLTSAKFVKRESRAGQMASEQVVWILEHHDLMSESPKQMRESFRHTANPVENTP